MHLHIALVQKQAMGERRHAEFVSGKDDNTIVLGFWGASVTEFLASAPEQH